MNADDLLGNRNYVSPLNISHKVQMQCRVAEHFGINRHGTKRYNSDIVTRPIAYGWDFEG